MLDDFILLSFSVFAVAAVIARGEPFAFLRQIGRTTYEMPRLWFHLLTPVRATLCTFCTGVWVAMPLPFMPVLPELEGINRIFAWLGPAGACAVLAYFTEPKDLDFQLPDLSQLPDDFGPRLGDATGDETQTEDGPA